MNQEVESPTPRKASEPAQSKKRTSAQPTPVSMRAAAPGVAPELRLLMIAEAAYYIAEHRGFEVGHDVEDWLVAESQIDAAIACGELPASNPSDQEDPA